MDVLRFTSDYCCDEEEEMLFAGPRERTSTDAESIPLSSVRLETISNCYKT